MLWSQDPPTRPITSVIYECAWKSIKSKGDKLTFTLFSWKLSVNSETATSKTTYEGIIRKRFAVDQLNNRSSLVRSSFNGFLVDNCGVNHLALVIVGHGTPPITILTNSLIWKDVIKIKNNIQKQTYVVKSFSHSLSRPQFSWFSAGHRFG